MDRTMLPYYGVRLLFSLAQLGLVLYLFRYVAVRVGLVDAYRRHAAARFLMLIPCAFAVVFAAGAALQLAVAFGAGHPELMRQNMGAVFNVGGPDVCRLMMALACGTLSRWPPLFWWGLSRPRTCGRFGSPACVCSTHCFSEGFP